MLLGILPTTALAVEEPDTDNIGDTMPLAAGDTDVGQGTKENPWDISADGEENHVFAYMEQNNNDSQDPTYTLTISGSGAMKGWNNSSSSGLQPLTARPWNDYTVTKLVIEEGITKIGRASFQNMTSLAGDIRIPNSVTEIEGVAFSGCTGLNGALTLGNSIEKIGASAFLKTQFTGDLDLPSSLQTLGQKAFNNCDKFSGTLTIGQGLTSIATSTFEESGFTGDLLIPDTLTSVGKNAFKNAKFSGNLTIGNGVTEIGDEAFYGCDFTGDLKLGSEIKKIGESAFKDCQFKGKLTWGQQIETIGDSAFNGLSSLSSQNLILTHVTNIGASAFMDCKGFSGALFLPKLEQIGNYAINGCEGLDAVVVGGDLKSISEFGLVNDAVEAIYFAKKVSIGSNQYSSDETALAVANGGTFAADTQFETGKLATPTKEGYTFGGWYNNENFNGDKVTNPTAGQTYYAKWVTEITFDANGGVGTMAAQQVTEGDTSTKLNANTFTRVGYTFAGWNTKKDGTGTAYADEANAPTTSTTLYAQWEPYTYTIKFDANGGTGNMDNVSAKYDQSVTLPNNAFTLAGKKFQGWATAENGPVVHQDGASVKNLTDVNGGEVTLYAVWGDKDAWNTTWTQQTKTYNGQIQGFDLDAGFTAIYQQNGQTVEPKNAGSYDVVISAAETADKLPYTYTFTSGLVIAPAPLTIQAEDQTIRAGKDLPEFTYTITGLVNGEKLAKEPTLTCDTDGKPPGEYPIVPSNADAGDNYEISYKNGTLTVTKRASGGSSSADKEYSVSVDDGKHGTVTVSPKRAEKGDTVTITVKPDKGYELDELIVTDSKGREIDLREKGENKFTFKMPGSKVTVEATFRAVEEIPEKPQVVNPFVDVNENAYYHDAVLWAVEKGITGGTSAATFSPDDACTRAQMVTFLWRAAGSPVVNYAMSFTDVPADAYYAEAVRWAVSQGITAGTSATTFSPNATVTRGQTVTFLWRAAGSPVVAGDSFADVAADAYYAPAVAWAVREGITSGVGAETFAPSADCTRGQIVTFLYRDMVK